MPEQSTSVPSPGEDQPARQKWFGIIQQLVIIWTITQLASKFFASKDSATPAVVKSNVQGGAQSIDARLLPPVKALPAWSFGQKLSMHVYLSTSPTGDVFSRKWTSGWRPDNDAELPSFVWNDITLGDYNDYRYAEYDIKFPESVLNNGSLWADVFLVKNDASPDPQDPAFNPEHIHHVRKLLTRYLARPKVRKEKSLLSSSDEEPEEEAPDVVVPHWHNNVTLALISDPTELSYAQLPAPLSQHVLLIPNWRDESGTIGYYKPIIFPNEFWHLRSHLIEVNTTTPSLPLRITFQPMSYFKFQMFASMTHGFDEAAKQQSGGAAEIDEVKRMLLETNPWFLATTALVSILHVVFEMLAFKSDVSHWRQKKEMVGVSVRTIITNVFTQAIVLLYLIDNNTDTSWMILMGSGMGVVVEAWKITKAMDISIKPSRPGALLPYEVEFKDKHVLSPDEKKTQEFDKLAFTYVGYVAIPLLIGYSVYSVIYETHRGWYSFIISTLTSFVYMFGFAQLIPQLIINYKLKSVAHMPMKAMIYKTLSTVVDDFFAFCIKMPVLHRLACFRDDVVFLIFLYQRWIYRIDPKRVNEYGQVMTEDADKAIEANEDKKKSKGESKKTR